jgi:hypothetical protein
MIFNEEQQEHLEDVMSTFRGNGQELANALGALSLGMMYGWKVIRVMYASSTYTKYQRILKLEFSDWCPPTTTLTSRHRGYQLAMNANSFWGLIRGSEAGSEEFKKFKKELA